MKIFKKRKTELDPDKAELYRSMGEAFAERLKLREWIGKINDFGSKKPKKFFSLLFVLLVVCFVVNTIVYRDRIAIEDITPLATTKGIINEEAQVKAEIKREMKSLYGETEYLMDTLTYIMSKPVMTAADSLFVAQKMARLEAINNILNQSYGDGEIKED